jgi:hypothetical protein
LSTTSLIDVRKTPTPRSRRRNARASISHATLRALIDEATVDCDNESEQATGLFTMMEEHLAVPFETTVLGMPVVVRRVDIDDQDVIIAVCHVARRRQKLRILDLSLPSPPPAGAEWIEAYRHWLRGRRATL